MKIDAIYTAIIWRDINIEVIKFNLEACVHFYVVQLPALHNFTNMHHWLLHDLYPPHIHSQYL